MTARVVAAARWGAFACSLLLAAARPATPGVAGGVVVLFALAAWGTSARAALLVPAVVCAATGGWASPFVPCVLPPVLLLGLSAGFAPAAVLSLVTVGLVSVAAASTDSLAWLVELLLLAAVAAHARRMEAGAARVADLEEANRLLEQLHALALHLPLSADVDEVVASTEAHIRSSLGAGASVSLGVPDDAAVVLRARGEVVGSVSVDRPLTASEQGVLDQVAAQAGLAIDNARRLSHLRSIAVYAERTRIARELHDQLGQDLAGLGFLLDARADHAELRTAVAGVVRRLRDTLADLRDDDSDLVGSLQCFLDRVSERSGLHTVLDARPGSLPRGVERELLRIAQEAVVNAERHSGASEVSVRVEEGVIEVHDDGIGLTSAARLDGHYGLVGMRERAEAIGGSLEIESVPGFGTTVRCRVVMGSPA